MAGIRAESMAPDLRQDTESALRDSGVRTESDPTNGDLLLPDGRGYITRVCFNNSLPQSIVRPSGAAINMTYGEEGRLRNMSEYDRRKLLFDYDEYGKITEIASGNQRFVLGYDGQGVLNRVDFADGIGWQLQMDQVNHSTLFTDRTGAITKYETTDDGFSENVTDPLGRVTVFQGDEPGNICAIRYPDLSWELMVRDEDSKEVITTRRDGSQIKTKLDDAGVATNVGWPDGSETLFIRDAIGSSMRISDKSGNLHLSHDKAKRTLKEGWGENSTRTTFDPDGRVISLSASGASDVHYSYDEDGRLTTITDWNGNDCQFVYSEAGNLAHIIFPNGLKRSFVFTPSDALANSKTIRSNGTVVSEQRYNYNPLDQLIAYADFAEGSQISNRRFTLDAEFRILQDTDLSNPSLTASFAYDAKGNMVQDGNRKVEFGLLDEPLFSDNREIVWDRLGNALSIPTDNGALSCEWSVDELLINVASEGASWTFGYDCLGRRISKSDGTSTWRFGWSGQKMIWEAWTSKAGSSGRRDYLFAADELSPIAFLENGNTFWCESDVRGAVTRVYNEQGTVVWAANYDSFGSARILVDRIRQPWRLCGQYCDLESLLHYSYHRFYSPQIKSYLSRDPDWTDATATTYSYCGNQPWMRVDPLGGPITLIYMMIFAYLALWFRWALRQLPLFAARQSSFLVEDFAVHNTTTRRLITTGRQSYTLYALGLPLTAGAFALTRLLSLAFSPRMTAASVSRYLLWLPYVMTPAVMLFEMNGPVCTLLGRNASLLQQCSAVGPITSSALLSVCGQLMILGVTGRVVRTVSYGFLVAIVGSPEFYVPLAANPPVPATGFRSVYVANYRALLTAAYRLAAPPLAFQAQHLIPKHLRTHALFTEIGFDFDNPFSLIFLPHRAGPYTPALLTDLSFSYHRGGHPQYSAMVGRFLDLILTSYSLHRSRGLAELEVYFLVRALRFMQEEGTPIYTMDGYFAEVRMYFMAFAWWLHPE